MPASIQPLIGIGGATVFCSVIWCPWALPAPAVTCLAKVTSVSPQVRRSSKANMGGRVTETPLRSSMTAMAPAASQPPAAAERQRALGQPLPVGRVEEHEAGLAAIAGGAEIGGVAAEDLGDAGQAEGLDVAADEAARLGVLLDEQAEGGAARQRLQAERAGAGEQVEHLDAVEARNPSMPCARMLNTASRTRSEVGRVPSCAGAASARPRNLPPTILMPSPWRLGGAACAEAGCSSSSTRTPSSAAGLRAQLLAQHARFDRLDRARLHVQQLERSVGDADQAVHRQAQDLQDACAPRGSCPRAGRCGSHTLAPCGLSSVGLDRAVAHALDLDAVLQLVEARLRDRRRARARDSAASSRSTAAPGGGRARRRWSAAAGPRC